MSYVLWFMKPASIQIKVCSNQGLVTQHRYLLNKINSRTTAQLSSQLSELTAYSLPTFTDMRSSGRALALIYNTACRPQIESRLNAWTHVLMSNQKV